MFMVLLAPDAFRTMIKVDQGRLVNQLVPAPTNPYSNAQAESFMKTLKVELVYLAGHETFADVVTRLPHRIEKEYNAKRLQSALSYRDRKSVV